jgi:hypothetical protein
MLDLVGKSGWITLKERHHCSEKNDILHILTVPVDSSLGAIQISNCGVVESPDSRHSGDLSK